MVSVGGLGVSAPDLYTLYQIDPRRNVEVLIETLGAEFNGVIGYG